MEESLPLSVYRRKDTGRLFFERRVGEDTYRCSRIRSKQEGALCHDILLLYISLLMIGAAGGKRKAAPELNYPDYSSTLTLEDLSKEFAEEKKDVVMNAILRQARDAAQAMPEQEHATRRPKVQKYSGKDVCSRSGDKSSSSKKDACSPSRGVKERLESAGGHTANDGEKRMDDVIEHASQCKHEYKSKVREREELERKVKDMTEDSGCISFGKPGSDKFHEHMARFKQLLSSDGCKWPPWVEGFEQDYTSEEYKCVKLRKELEGHIMRSIPESLMRDGNTMTGRRREDERERPSPVLEIFSTVEENSCSTDELSNLVAPPTSTPVLDDAVLCVEIDCATPSVESDLSEPVALHESALLGIIEDSGKCWSPVADAPFHTGCQEETQNENLEEVYDDEEYSQDCLWDHTQGYQDDWTYGRDWTNRPFSSLLGFVDAIPLQNPPSTYLR